MYYLRELMNILKSIIKSLIHNFFELIFTQLLVFVIGPLNSIKKHYHIII